LSVHRFGSRNRSATSDYVDRERDDYDARPSQVPHNPTRPVDKDKAEAELQLAMKKATNPDETAPKQKHVRSASSVRSLGSCGDQRSSLRLRVMRDLQVSLNARP
jgi:hypothetical protein